MSRPRYMVISSCGAEQPVYNGVSHIHAYDNLDDVKLRVRDIVGEYSEYIGVELKPGMCLDEDNDPTDSVKYAAAYYSDSGLSAWCRGTSENWERVECFELSAEGCYERIS